MNSLQNIWPDHNAHLPIWDATFDVIPRCILCDKLPFVHVLVVCVFYERHMYVYLQISNSSFVFECFEAMKQRVFTRGTGLCTTQLQY